MFPPGSADLNSNVVHAVSGSAGTHDGADGLGDPALLADDSAHVVLCYMQMEYDHAFLVRLVLGDLDGILVVHQTGNDGL